MTDKRLNNIKLLSIVLFLIITKPGNHISIPMVFGLIISLFYFLEEASKEFFIPFLSLVGVVSLIFSLRIKKTLLVYIGYLLTYLMLLNFVKDQEGVTILKKNSLFFSSIIVYFLLSFFVLFKTVENDFSKK